jgi:hypothetical protein
MSSTNDDWFVIKDLDNFIDATRALVFNNFGKNKDSEEPDLISFSVHPNDLKEINSVLSFDESKLIILGVLKKQKNKRTKSIRYLITDEIYLNLIYALNDRMVSNILNGLVNKGLVESAYDDESNDFVFWIKNNDIQKPETD